MQKNEREEIFIKKFSPAKGKLSEQMLKKPRKKKTV